MAREYTAFISYRHCPLDIAVAETLHKHIERFRVPKDLRKDGKTGLGVVFRDRDELPLSNNLTQNIYEALDHAKFLIVVCTPETPKSIWVEREIEYFIEKHGRERILTVLAAGTPEESIPKIITNIYAPDGETVVDRVEPLCAFLVDGDEKKVLKNLKKEFLRLVAAILGCHYDALVQRQKRYRAQMITYAVGVLAVIALLFVGMLVNRNREIEQKRQEIVQKNQEIEERKQELEEQLRQTQINESQALSLLSQQQLADGDRLGAIKSALNALPHDGDGRPYSAAAEGALADALNVYGNMELDYYLTIEQPVDVRCLTLSDDGAYLVTVDTLGGLRCFDTLSTAMLWEWHPGGNTNQTEEFSVEILEIIEGRNTVLYSDQETTYSFSLETGEEFNRVSFYAERNDSSSGTGTEITLSSDETLFAQISRPDAKNVGADTDDPYDAVYYLEVYRSDTFELIHSHIFKRDDDWNVMTPTFSLDNSRLAVLFANEDMDSMELFVLDTTTWEEVHHPIVIPSVEVFSYVEETHLAWLPENELLFYYERELADATRTIEAYFTRFGEEGENEQVGPYYTYYRSGGEHTGGDITHYLTDTHIYYNVGNSGVFALELDTLQRTSNYSDILAGSYLRKNGDLMLVTDAGQIGYVTNSKSTMEDYRIYQHWQGARIAVGICGEREVLCLVPENALNTVVIVSEPVYHDVVEFPALGESGFDFDDMEYVVFPSGKAFLAFDDVSYFEDKVTAMICDAFTLEITDSFIVEGGEAYDFSGFSADETKLFFKGFIYDMHTHTLSEYENGSELYGDYHSLIDSPALNNQLPGMPMLAAYEKSDILYWWTDGANLKSSPIPYDMETYAYDTCYTAFTHLGGSGLFVQPLFEDKDCKRTNAYGVFSTGTEEWHLLENPVNSAGFPRFSVGNTKRVVAFADFDRVLRVYDFDKDAIIHEWPLTVSPSTVERLQYIANDQYLLIFTESNTIHLIDMRDGTELGSYYGFTTESVYAHNGVVYLCSSYKNYRIDLATGSLLATIPYMKCYLPNTNRAICVYGDQLVAIPVYTCEELVKKGWELIHTVEENRIS